MHVWVCGLVQCGCAVVSSVDVSCSVIVAEQYTPYCSYEIVINAVDKTLSCFTFTFHCW